MGCHTWAYVHIPAEADKWAQDYKDAFIKVARKVPTYDEITAEDIKLAKELEELVKNTPIKDIPKLLGEKQGDDMCCDLMIGCVSLGNYGLFVIHNGKIYRDPHDLNLEHGYHDMFRIYDYEAPPCYSLEETLKRCEDYKVNWNFRECNGYLVNDKKRIYEFWEKFPDSIIEFG